mmetsp:Transcript_13008/g.28711  ORF Transcript_13008/g.28711 Transcript_13008/m.28711 type:complete len:226 (+) Transcript_13008:405-1082(+)
MRQYRRCCPRGKKWRKRAIAETWHYPLSPLPVYVLISIPIFFPPGYFRSPSTSSLLHSSPFPWSSNVVALPPPAKSGAHFLPQSVSPSPLPPSTDPGLPHAPASAPSASFPERRHSSGPPVILFPASPAPPAAPQFPHSRPRCALRRSRRSFASPRPGLPPQSSPRQLVPGPPAMMPAPRPGSSLPSAPQFRPIAPPAVPDAPAAPPPLSPGAVWILGPFPPART